MVRNRGSWWDRCREGSKEELGGKILADVAAGRTFHDLIGAEAHDGHTWCQSTAERQSATCSTDDEPMQVWRHVVLPKVALVQLFHHPTISEIKANIKQSSRASESSPSHCYGKENTSKMLQHRELAAPGSVMGTGIDCLDPDAPLDLSKYATAELKLVVDLDYYAVRDEAYRRSERLVKRLATAEKRVSDLHRELKECGLAIDAASKQATAEQNRTGPNA